MPARSRLLIKVFFRENQDIKTTSGWTLSPHWIHLGMKPEADPRLLSSSTTIPHNHSYLAHYGSYRSAPQLPEAPAVGHFDTADGVFLATCSSSLRKEANTRYHTDARKGVAFLTHSEVGLPRAGGEGWLRQGDGRSHHHRPEPTLQRYCKNTLLSSPVWKKANAS